jgi:hypothetical protein
VSPPPPSPVTFLFLAGVHPSCILVPGRRGIPAPLFQIGVSYLVFLFLAEILSIAWRFLTEMLSLAWLILLMISLVWLFLAVPGRKYYPMHHACSRQSFLLPPPSLLGRTILSNTFCSWQKCDYLVFLEFLSGAFRSRFPVPGRRPSNSSSQSSSSWKECLSCILHWQDSPPSRVPPHGRRAFPISCTGRIVLLPEFLFLARVPFLYLALAE